MISILTTLRQNAPRITARQFLLAHPGSWVQYYDDTPARDPAKALSARTFDPAVARERQSAQCAVGFSLQPFDKSTTRDQLLCYRTLGVDVDLVPRSVRSTLPPAAIAARKEEYLQRVLAFLPLRPHWLIETRHGFQALFRVQPQREPSGVAAARALNRRLVRALRGVPSQAPLTQLARVPGTLQFEVPGRPFLCRLLLDNTLTILPYPLATVGTALDVWERRAVARPVQPRPPHTNQAPSGPALGERQSDNEGGSASTPTAC